MRISEIDGMFLDWAVAKIEEPNLVIEDFLIGRDSPNGDYRYSEDWSQGGLIIERECIDVCSNSPENWSAFMFNNITDESPVITGEGPTPLVAAMRCYVASKLGDEIEIPKELG